MSTICYIAIGSGFAAVISCCLIYGMLLEIRRLTKSTIDNAVRCEKSEDSCGSKLAKVTDLHDCVRTMPQTITAVSARVLAQSGVPR